ncbi:hypothetical protein ACEUZ9_000290, partial [Paracoccus litorisediminis]|uniref:hypothetical protein n=1 Tax=Paracoccus litorisediminis TaxID=2006130 RepID=UPI0037313048
ASSPEFSAQPHIPQLKFRGFPCAGYNVMLVGSRAVTDHLAGGQKTFMRGMADAYDDGHDLPRGTWKNIDYSLPVFSFSTSYLAGYDYQETHDLLATDLEETFAVSSGWVRMARMASDILAREYAGIPGADKAVAASILGGVIDATASEVQPDPNFLAVIEALARTGDKEVDGTLRRLRLTVEGVHSQFFAGEHLMLAKLAGEAVTPDREANLASLARAMRADVMARLPLPELPAPEAEDMPQP